MTSRRELLQIGLTGSALLALSPLINGAIASAPPARLYKAIYDERFPSSLAFARELDRQGVHVHGIRGDVTALWYHDLHFQWKEGSVELAGMTTSESLFCLEMLARDAGQRVTSRRMYDDGLVSWTIGPRR